MEVGVMVVEVDMVQVPPLRVNTGVEVAATRATGVGTVAADEAEAMTAMLTVQVRAEAMVVVAAMVAVVAAAMVAVVAAAMAAAVGEEAETKWAA